MEEPKQVLQNFENEIKSVDSPYKLEILKQKYLGKKGAVQQLMDNIKNLPAENRREYGIFVNGLKTSITDAIVSYTQTLQTKEIEKNLQNIRKIDLSEIDYVQKGSLHPITIVQKEIEDIFVSMGFSIEDGEEIVSEYENFEAVNVPKNHPARDMQDTYWLENGQLLKTHTSALQNRILKKYPLPLKVIFPGRCFRNESIDASHDTTFFQLEGVVVDENISIANLKYFMQILLDSVLGEKLTVRLRPGYFPFVEPGFELDIMCKLCEGKGCSACKNSGWLELLPCGMIHPNVLKMGGVDSEKYSGFAFGLGLTRLAMMKYGIKDIRELNSGNLKVLKQF